jgi:hypothetical protein
VIGILSKEIGEPCPKCAMALERQPRAFYWRGAYRDGAFCKSCNAVWPINGEEIEPLRKSAP